MKLGRLTTVAVVHVGVYCLLLLLIGTGTSHVNACTLDGCDHPDCGSCGNACCSLLITVQESTEAVMHKLNQSITEEGGPDQLYIPMMTASGTLTFSDLRQYGAGADFLGQALHTTLNGKYNDTVNFSLSPTTIAGNHKNKEKNKKRKGTIISAFSISDIAGAYCDSGQNYWNILQLIEGIQWDNGDAPLIEHVGESCPTTATTNSKTPPRVHKHKKEQEETNNDGSSEEEPEDNSLSSEDEDDTDSASFSSKDETIPETTTTTDDDDDVGNENDSNNFNALSKNMDTTTDDPLLRPLSMGKYFLIVVVGVLFLVSGSITIVLMRKKKLQARKSAAAHSSSSFRENYGRL